MAEPIYTHTVKLREGKAKAEKVTTEQLEQMKKSIVGFRTGYDVTPIEKAEKPEPLAKAASKSEGTKPE